MNPDIRNMWEKASTSYSRRISDQDRATRKLSLRRVSFKAHPQLVQLLVELYYCANPDSYDDAASDIVVLSLTSNSYRDAMENRILSVFDDDGNIRQDNTSEVISELMNLAEVAVRSIDRLYTPATRVRIRTESSGNVTYSTSEENELIFNLPQVPRSISSLRPPTVQITSLKRLGPAGRFGLLEGIDRVQWNGHDGEYAFKRAGKDEIMTVTEIELLLLSTLQNNDAARTLRISAVVLDARNRIRGFLSHFERYGSLEEVFVNRLLLPRHGEESLRAVGSTVFPRQLEWKEKLRWAAHLARGVALLHDGYSNTGSVTLRNLNPRNVLVSGNATSTSAKDTYLIIAGFRGAASPTGMRFSKLWAAPERLRKSTYELGTALDVANLGMVLWALAEEKFDTGFPDIYSSNEADARRESSASTSSRRGQGGPVQQGRSDLWKKANPPTPAWYRLLVESCVELEPARRPKAAEVASALERQLQLSR